ncbi:MAG: ATP-binding protein [Clostridiales bacterium]|nr:ATP-binding protein [Clostridiales bacterium]
MIIAVASGKGGTGKTTISTALAEALEKPVQLLDCDVEEPNAHIFFNTENETKENVYVKVPQIAKNSCTLCGRCAQICEFNALAVIKEQVMVFDELCHSCGGCKLVCPEKAISEVDMQIGKLKRSTTDGITLIQGELDVGRAMSPPVIRAVKKHIKSKIINIIDCPPGNACPLVTAVSNADYVILVTEDSLFGLNDLLISIDTIKKMNIPMGVIVNRCGISEKSITEHLRKKKIDILLEIPENIGIAKAYSNGGSILSVVPSLKNQLVQIIAEISRGVYEANTHR